MSLTLSQVRTRSPGKGPRTGEAELLAAHHGAIGKAGTNSRCGKAVPRNSSHATRTFHLHGTYHQTHLVCFTRPSPGIGSKIPKPQGTAKPFTESVKLSPHLHNEASTSHPTSRLQEGIIRVSAQIHLAWPRPSPGEAATGSCRGWWCELGNRLWAQQAVCPATQKECHGADQLEMQRIMWHLDGVEIKAWEQESVQLGWQLQNGVTPLPVLLTLILLGAAVPWATAHLWKEGLGV